MKKALFGFSVITSLLSTSALADTYKFTCKRNADLSKNLSEASVVIEYSNPNATGIFDSFESKVKTGSFTSIKGIKLNFKLNGINRVKTESVSELYIPAMRTITGNQSGEIKLERWDPKVSEFNLIQELKNNTVVSSLKIQLDYSKSKIFTFTSCRDEGLRTIPRSLREAKKSPDYSENQDWGNIAGGSYGY